jgi:D-alanyl-D-alanine carboxypeptidase
MRRRLYPEHNAGAQFFRFCAGEAKNNQMRSEMKTPILLLAVFALSLSLLRAQAPDSANSLTDIPPAIKAILEKPIYKHAIWGLRVVDFDTGTALMNLEPDHNFFIGSVRKVFSVGELLNEIGPEHAYNTPVYRHGRVDHAGILHGDLILDASGDITMGGRTNPDASIAISDYDHNEADSLGNAVLTKPDPLAGYMNLARQVARSGITEIKGNVVIDDRLFKPFNFRDQFNLRPIFVNDDLVDLSINPKSPGDFASVAWRPHSAALGIENALTTSGKGSAYTLKLHPELPQCIGHPDCNAEISGEIPVDFTPPLTDKLPLVQAFRIVQPSNYARTVFIEALEAAGVKVDAPPVAGNPVNLLPHRRLYPPNTKAAELKGQPYSDDAKFILKVSYNIGADTSLLLFGLTQGVDNMDDALKVEKQNLISHYGMRADSIHFIDGSGGGSTTATNQAVTQMLAELKKRVATFPAFFNALPILGVDGTLGSVTDFEKDTSLAAARGQVRAKTGTFVAGSESGLTIKGQAFGGYIAAKSGNHLVYQLVVNNVEVKTLEQMIPVLLQIFQDEGAVSAILWRDF